ncbi:MAG: hypothetical protein A2145_06995 [candidate division Zixibacteria bacterium RBG_16_40_9]|nr:MAG: hypothetical protein A2145_06995 [candidate division Zixibacteria bacterium RBG_16_40_9]
MSVIVLIEDDLFFSSKIENLLKSSNYEIHTISKTEGLLDSLKQDIPDLILINLASSNLNPLSIIPEIKNQLNLRSIPIIGYCGHTQRELIEKALKLGCDKVLPNSVIVSTLPKLLNQILQPKL